MRKAFDLYSHTTYVGQMNFFHLPRLTILITAVLFITVPGFAVEFSGTLVLKNNKTFLKTNPKNKQLYLLEVKDGRIQNQLSKLKTGDFISGNGSFTVKSHKIYLRSLHFVGLKKLIGEWESQHHEVFHFEDFTNLTLYKFLSFDARGIPSVRKVNYRLAPESDGNWSIILVNKETVNIGKLEIRRKRITINIYDGFLDNYPNGIKLSRIKKMNP